MEEPFNRSAFSEAVRILVRMTEFLEKETDLKRLEEKYGEGFIIVNWMFVDNAIKMPFLKRVCTWGNGDEGFVPVDTNTLQ